MYASRWAPFFVLGAIVACEGESRVERSPFGDVPPVSEDNLAEVTASSFCEPLEACCAAWGVPFERARCEEFLATMFMPATELVRDGRATLDETAARRCIVELSATLDSCTLEGSASCRRALSGTTPEGASCSTDEECVAPSDGNGLCLSEETCSFRSRAGLGEGCRDTCREELELWQGFWPAMASSFCYASGAVGSSAQCFRNDGLHCARSTGRCERLLPVGSACVTGQCEMHLWCDDGTCSPRISEGGSCDSLMYSTVEPTCGDDLTCDADRCVPTFRPSLTFEPAESICGAE